MILLLPAALLRLWWRGRKNPAYRQRIGERLGFLPASVPSGALWIHAVSVGESQATQPLVRWLLHEFPQLSLVITTTTPTGGERVEQLYGERVCHLYFPFDTPAIMQRYFAALQPRAVLIMETEVWPNLLRQCAQQGVPVALINARLSMASARGYQKVQDFAAQVFSRLDLVIAQSGADAERLQALGVQAEKLRVCGSIKFDIRVPPSVREQGELLRAALGADRPIWIAASTHANEEALALAAHRILLQQYPDALLILVPRHPERFEEVAALIASSKLRFCRRSVQSLDCAGTSVFLGDVMGELPVFYGAADVAFVGGSLVPVGGHNILEPAGLGIAVVHGPHMHNFLEISRLLGEAGGAIQVDASSLASTLLQLLADPVRRQAMGQKGRQVVADNQGATACTQKAIAALLATVAILPASAAS